jgi:uncharacterized protein
MVLVVSTVSALAALAAQPPAAVPPPVPQRTALCASPTFATDQLVCGDAGLRERDQRLADLYARADRMGLPEEGEGFESAHAWFLRRSRCAFEAVHRECALAAYRERSALIEALLTAPAVRPLETVCGARRWQSVQVGTSEGIQVLVLTAGDGHLAGAAPMDESDPAWRPFLTARVAGRELTLTSSDGTPTRCTLSTVLSDVPDDGLRQRVEVVDALLRRAKTGFDTGDIDRAAYGAMLRWLRDEELTVAAEARLRRFADPGVHNYWHRSRLKFPTLTAQELARLDGR